MVSIFWRFHKQIEKEPWDSIGKAWEQGVQTTFRGLGPGTKRTVFLFQELMLWIGSTSQSVGQVGY